MCMCPYIFFSLCRFGKVRVGARCVLAPSQEEDYRDVDWEPLSREELLH